MRKKNNIVPEIVIPEGYEIDELLDMDEEEEEPICGNSNNKGGK